MAGTDLSMQKSKTTRSWIDIAMLKSVRKRAFRVAIIVGIILMSINHGDKLLAGTVSSVDLFKIILTFFVPYSVSTYSSVLTYLEEKQTGIKEFEND